MIVNNGCIQLLVVQPTPFCNISCKYCYLSNRSSKDRMSIQTINLIGSEILSKGWCAKNVTIIWHAGEPTVISPSWYHDAFEILQNYCPPDVRLTHSFQSNGILLSDQWIDLLKKWDVRLGISIDGPKELHDVNRLTRDGKGTWESTISAIRMLKNAQIPFHVITVLTKESLTNAQVLFDFYLSEKIDHVCFNIEEIEGINLHSSLETEQITTIFSQFLNNFLQYSKKERYPIWIREFSYGLATILQTGTSVLPNQQATPLEIVSVDVNGNLSTFSPELLGSPSKQYGNFIFSSLRDGGIPAILDSEFFRAVHSDIELGVKKCEESCEWFRWCGGGAPANKLFENGSFVSTETLYCRLTKKTVLETLLLAIENNILPEMMKIR